MRVDWILAAAHVNQGAEAAVRLRNIAPTSEELLEALPALERHGILGLVVEQLRTARIQGELLDSAALIQRRRVMHEDGLRDQLTLECVLGSARRANCRVILLKGASLAQDVYAMPGLRAAGDVDILVPTHRLDPLLDALAEDGLLPLATSFPRWWYRLTHFHMKVRHELPMCKEVEVHWHLHHAALGLATDIDRLWTRALPVPALGPHAFTLDALDRLLHLATHFASHGAILDPSQLPGLFLTGEPRVRWKWMVDLAAVVEACAIVINPTELQQRVHEWNAAPLAAPVFAFLGRANLIGATAIAWIQSAGLPLSTTRPSATDLTSARPASGLDFRFEALRRLPRYIFPSSASLRRSARSSRTRVRLLQPLITMARLLRILLATLLLPAAWIGRAILLPRRTAARRAARAPERTLDIVSRWVLLGGNAPHA